MGAGGGASGTSGAEEMVASGWTLKGASVRSALYEATDSDVNWERAL